MSEYRIVTRIIELPSRTDPQGYEKVVRYYILDEYNNEVAGPFDSLSRAQKECEILIENDNDHSSPSMGM